MDPSGRDSRYNLNYSMSIGLSMGDNPDIYGQTNPALVRPPSGLSQSMSRSGNGGLMNTNTQCGSMSNSRGIKRTSSDCFDDRGGIGSQSLNQLESCSSGVTDVVEDSYSTLQKKSPPANGKKTKGRVKIKMEYIDNKLRRYTTFSKRKTGIMKKAYELSTLTGTQVMLLVASETGHVYTFATRKLQPMITSEAGKQLIQTCLNSPDPPSGTVTGDQRMSATGFEETELSYNIGDDDSKVRQLIYSHGHHHGHAHLGHPQPTHYGIDQSLMQPNYATGGQASPLSHTQSYVPPHAGHAHHVPHSHAGHMNHAHAQR